VRRVICGRSGGQPVGAYFMRGSIGKALVMQTINVECDATPIQTALDELSQLPLEIVQGLFDSLDSLGELIRFESSSAAGAIKITLHPSQRLLELTSATRTS
jgi:hypothetical protein